MFVRLLMIMLAAGALVSGCGTTPESSRSQIQEDGGERGGRLDTLPLREQDMGAFTQALFRQAPVTAAQSEQFRILDRQDAAGGTYVLYSSPNNDGLAFAGRRADGTITIHQAGWPLVQTNAAQEPVVVRAVPPNNEVNPGYGVLAGRVFNPFIEHIEVSYRDGRVDRADVTHNRGFIMVRKAFDPRFVQVKAYGMNGNPYWNLDTR